MTTVQMIQGAERPIAERPIAATLRTEKGTRLHIAPCPFLGPSAREAEPSERAAMSVCSWCQAEIDGAGRTYFDNLEDAMRFFGTHLGSEHQVREAVRFVTSDQVWVPHSKSYIALGLEGAAVAWIGKTYVVPGPGLFVELPDYSPQQGGGAERSERLGELCELHFIARGLNGSCEHCD